MTQPVDHSDHATTKPLCSCQDDWTDVPSENRARLVERALRSLPERKPDGR